MTKAKSKTKRTHPCAPAIWKKLGATEKTWWMMFYREFLGELNLKATEGATTTRTARRIIAHNHACLAVWRMRKVMDRAMKALKEPVK